MGWALASKNFNKCNTLLRQYERAARTCLVAALVTLLVSACASSQSSEGYEEVWDPIEPFNRAVFQVNEAVDFMIIRPIAATYRQVVPDPLQEMVTNFLRNLKTPIILVNELLQGDWEGAEVAATRFFLNSSLGLGGILDIAGYGNPDLAYRSEDFGQTLAVWGVGDGPYLVLPILGPSNLRDGTGLVVDTLADPVTYAVDDETFDWVRLGLTAVDTRARLLDPLDEIRASSLDFYAAVRSLYWQNRRSEIYDGNPPASDAFPDFEDFEDEDFEDFDDEVLDDSSRPTVLGPVPSGAFLSEATPPVATTALASTDILILDLEPLRKTDP